MDNFVLYGLAVYSLFVTFAFMYAATKSIQLKNILEKEIGNDD